MTDTLTTLAAQPEATGWQIASLMAVASIFTFSVLNAFWGPNQ